MSQLRLLVPPPPLWVILLCNLIVLIAIIVLFIVIICAKRRPLCVTPTESDLLNANKVRSRKGSPGKAVSKTHQSVKVGFSFKDHGDDIGTDMSDEEHHQLKPVDEGTATAFDPHLVAVNLITAEQADDEALQKKRSLSTLHNERWNRHRRA
ncbi:hypothetical protein COOONC_12740 [Cooperia oncophora]